MGNHEVNCRLCGEDLRGLHGGHAVGCDGNTYTQPQTKYPGADTSKERLASITRERQEQVNHYAQNDNLGARHDLYRTVRDLLAMIEERDRRIEYMEAANEARDENISLDGDDDDNIIF